MDENTEKEMFDLFKGFLDSIDFKYHYEDSEGNVIDYPEKTTSKTSDDARYNAPKTEVKEDKKSAEVIDALKKLLSEKYKEINELKKRNNELVESSKSVLNNGKNLVDENSKIRNYLRKSLYNDGYRMLSELKQYIERAREYSMIEDSNFKEPLSMIQKTVNDFAASRKPIC